MSIHQAAGPTLLQRHLHQDERGSLERLFAADELAAAGVIFEAVHINLTRTTHPGTVKGLHLQRRPHAEAKIVTCLAGRIFDVAVDLRHDSPTYGQWFGVELSPDKPESLLIPEGFAHGMQCLEPNSMVHYVHSASFAPAAEIGVHPLDPDVAVAWPLPPQYLSLRDQSLPWLADFGEVAR
ncbi:MAG: dTDP-4-dehydrorhamnose 3-epimerase [Nitrospira sp.]|nr:dTDP-4-dehydrorhamnose 3-epimerase [Nitrospira sp.]